MPASTRLAIVLQSLTDSLERLRELQPAPRVRELMTRALQFERACRSWNIHPPSEEQRAAMVKLVLELNVEVMAVGRDPKPTEKSKT